MSNGLTNVELVKYLGLPSDIITEIATGASETYQAAKNTFLDALYNKVIYSEVTGNSFDNPFKKYDGYPVQYGDTVESIFVETPSGYKYDENNENPFKQQKPSVKALYSSINYDMQYKVTIKDAILRKACLNQYGFMGLIDYILMSLQEAMKLDEYFATIKMLNNVEIFADGFETISVKGMTDEDKAKLVAKKIVNTTSLFSKPNKKNNKMKVMTNAKSDNILLVIKTELLNSINMDYLTGVFNLNKVDLIKNIIDVETFQVEQYDTTTGAVTLVGEDLDFMIIDTRGFENHVALQDGGMIYNPEGKYTNHYTNLWKILAFKYFRNARAFKLNNA